MLCIIERANNAPDERLRDIHGFTGTDKLRSPVVFASYRPHLRTTAHLDKSCLLHNDEGVVSLDSI